MVDISISCSKRFLQNKSSNEYHSLIHINQFTDEDYKKVFGGETIDTSTLKGNSGTKSQEPDADTTDDVIEVGEYGVDISS